MDANFWIQLNKMKGCSTHLYLNLLAGTGYGKQPVIDITKDCLLALQLQKYIGPNRFKSGPGLIRWVESNKVTLCVQDEFGALMAKLGNPRAADYELEISEHMRELWGLQPGSMYNTNFG